MSTNSIAAVASLPRSTGKRIIRREDAANWIDGHQFLEEARREAESLLKSAHEAYEEAKARGFEEGQKEGDAKAAEIVAETSAKVEQYLQSVEAQIADLSLAIVEQVLGKRDDAEVVARVAEQALRSFRTDKYVKVRVSREVIDEVQQALGAWSAADLTGAMITVEADPRLEARQCTIASDFAVIDASLDVQLEIIRRTLTASAAAGRSS